MLTRLEYRILQLSYKHKLSHIGSCISVLPIFEHIYRIKNENDHFVNGAGHAGLALYVMLETIYGYNAEEILEKYGIHSTRAPEYKIEVSGGSLGLAESVALGMAMTTKNNVYLVSTDGGIVEGICSEVMQLCESKTIHNLQWFINNNGWAAYDRSNLSWFEDKENGIPAITVKTTGLENMDHVNFWYRYPTYIPFLKDQSAHYYRMSDEDWNWVQDNKLQ